MAFAPNEDGTETHIQIRIPYAGGTDRGFVDVRTRPWTAEDRHRGTMVLRSSNTASASGGSQ